MGTEIFDIFQVAIGVYLLFFAITGKGAIYKNEYVKQGMEQKYYKTIRIGIAVLGPVVMLSGAIGMFNWDAPNGVFSLTVWGISLAGFIALMVMTSRLTVKQKDRPVAPPRPAGKHPAFDFDDEDEDKQG